MHSRKGRMTVFLERYEIWFKTVLWLTVTVAALSVSYASYSLAKNQQEEAAIAAEKEELEKKPFFSVENIYDEEKEQYIFYVTNTGGQIRDFNVIVTPYLHLHHTDAAETISSMDTLGMIDTEKAKDIMDYFYTGKESGGEGVPFDDMFIQLDDFINYEETFPVDNCLVAFSDVFLETSEGADGTGTSRELANDYFWRTVDELEPEKPFEWIRTELAYKLVVTYYDYKNEITVETAWFGHRYDDRGISGKGSVLAYFEYIGELYDEANDNRQVYYVLTSDRPIGEILNECNENIKAFVDLYKEPY